MLPMLNGIYRKLYKHIFAVNHMDCGTKIMVRMQLNFSRLGSMVACMSLDFQRPLSSFKHWRC